MAIVIYRCDTCKREKEFKQNEHGMEQFGRCSITQGCRGFLQQVKVCPDFIRESIPNPVTGLDDWFPRRVLFNHTQAIARDSWVITHNMATNPITSIFVNRPLQEDPNNVEEIIPKEVIIRDENTIEVIFDQPYSGFAQLIARQTDPNDQIITTTTPQQEETTIIQASNQGEITLATRDNTLGTSPLFTITLTFSSTPTQLSITYGLDDQPAIYSPWSDADKVLIDGEVYTIRSFNGIVTEMVNGTILSGTNFYFDQVDPQGLTNFQDIQSKDILMLLSSSPHTNVDKILTQYIDVTKSTPSTNPFAFIYNNGEFYTQNNITTDVYPHVRLL